MMEYVSKQENLRTEDVSRIVFQLLSSVDHCAKNNVIHRDIKPENTMFRDPSSTAELRLIDFGSSCFENERIYTYIQSRFYRAPEIIMGIPYTSAIDIWSFGCILAELYSGYPLFPGESEHDQLGYIMEI